MNKKDAILISLESIYKSEKAKFALTELIRHFNTIRRFPVLITSTKRNSVEEELVRIQLEQDNISYEGLYLIRTTSDMIKTMDTGKKKILDRIENKMYNIILAIEDDPELIEELGKRGVFTLV